MPLTWLPEPTVAALRAALRTAAPDLAEGAIVPRGLEPNDDPRWCAASAVAGAPGGGRYVVKFAWSRTAALRVRHQARVLAALRTAAPGLPVPEVVAATTDPVLVILRWVDAAPFFAVRHRIGDGARDGAARDLATVLARMHEPAVLREVARTAGPLPAPEAHATTDTLRARFAALVRPGQGARIRTWCDRADAALAAPGRTVLVHGDFHGDNHLWDPDTLHLRLVVDLETAGTGEPEFDLRCLPSDCGPELFTATVAHYARLTGTPLDVDRILAWHVRTVLGDALWRAEAGVPLPDRRTPEQWVDDLAERLGRLGAFT